MFFTGLTASFCALGIIDGTSLPTLSRIGLKEHPRDTHKVNRAKSQEHVLMLSRLAAMIVCIACALHTSSIRMCFNAL